VLSGTSFHIWDNFYDFLMAVCSIMFYCCICLMDGPFTGKLFESLPQINQPAHWKRWKLLVSNLWIYVCTSSTINKPISQQITSETYPHHSSCWKWSLMLCMHLLYLCRMYIMSHVRGSMTNNNGFWFGWLNFMALLLQSLRQSLIVSCYKSRSIPFWTMSISSTVSG
jgi:hypothetical protein